MSFCKIDDSLASAIGEGLFHSFKLKYLDLSENSIGNDGAYTIASVLTIKRCGITNLNLSRNSIGIKGGKMLATMIKSNEKLIHCNLSGN
jgi:Ran GTPase-activating protein (RanGAP) involved in mRNA processing and transport